MVPTMMDMMGQNIAVIARVLMTMLRIGYIRTLIYHVFSFTLSS